MIGLTLWVIVFSCKFIFSNSLLSIKELKSREDIFQSHDRLSFVADCHYVQRIDVKYWMLTTDSAVSKRSIFVVRKITVYYHHFVAHCGSFCGLEWRIWRTILVY